MKDYPVIPRWTGWLLWGVIRLFDGLERAQRRVSRWRMGRLRPDERRGAARTAESRQRGELRDAFAVALMMLAAIVVWWLVFLLAAG